MSEARRPSLTAVFSASFLGGSEIFNLEFLGTVREQGVEIDAIVPGPGTLADALVPVTRSLRIVAPPVELTELSRFDESVNVGALPRRARALGRYVRAMRSALDASSGPICAFGFRSQLAVAVTSAGSRRPIAWVVHEVVPDGPYGRLWSYASRRVHRAFGYSQAAVRQAQLRAPQPVLHRVRLPLRPFAAVPDPSFPPRTLGLLGDLFPLKNHLGAIEVIGRLRAEGHEVSGLLVGRDVSATNPTADYTTRVRDRVAELGDVVDLVAATPSEMPGLIARTDVLLHLSRAPESFGRVCAEAMAAGRPVVAFDHGAVSHVVGDTGVLCPVGDLGAVVRAVGQLRSDEAFFQRSCAAGRRRALDHFGEAGSGSTIGDALAAFAVEQSSS